MNSRETKKVMTVFSLASFLNDFGSDIIYPVWPLFVLSFAGVNMAVLGFIDGLGEAIVSISQAFSGYLSDRIGKRKVFIWTGYLFGASSRMGYALSKLSTYWQFLIPFRILDRSGKIRGAPRDAIIADISTDENRGRNFGLLRAMDNLGAVCGIITCILFIALLGYDNLPLLFFLASVPSIIGATLVFIFIKERKTEKIFKGLSFKDLTFNLKLFMFLSAIFSIGTFSYSFLLYFATQSPEYGSAFGTILLPVFYLIFTFVAFLMSLPFGKLADVVGRKKVLVLSYVIWALMCIGFIFTESLLGIALLFILYGLHKAAIEPVQKALVSELAPERYRASILGAFQLAVGVCALPASSIAGILAIFGKFAPLTFSFGLVVVATILLLFVKEKRSEKQ